MAKNRKFKQVKFGETSKFSCTERGFGVFLSVEINYTFPKYVPYPNRG